MAKKSNKPTSNLDMFYVFREGDDYYIHAEYLEERPDGLHKITVHKSPLRLFKDRPNVRTEAYCLVPVNERIVRTQGAVYIDFGFGEILQDPTQPVFTDELIKPVVKEMTIRDIEKELGYSIKIIKDKENKK